MGVWSEIGVIVAGLLIPSNGTTPNSRSSDRNTGCPSTCMEPKSDKVTTQRKRNRFESSEVGKRICTITSSQKVFIKPEKSFTFVINVIKN